MRKTRPMGLVFIPDHKLQESRNSPALAQYNLPHRTQTYLANEWMNESWNNIGSEE